MPSDVKGRKGNQQIEQQSIRGHSLSADLRTSASVFNQGKRDATDWQRHSMSGGRGHSQNVSNCCRSILGSLVGYQAIHFLAPRNISLVLPVLMSPRRLSLADRQQHARTRPRTHQRRASSRGDTLTRRPICARRAAIPLPRIAVERHRSLTETMDVNCVKPAHGNRRNRVDDPTW